VTGDAPAASVRNSTGASDLPGRSGLMLSKTRGTAGLRLGVAEAVEAHRDALLTGEVRDALDRGRQRGRELLELGITPFPVGRGLHRPPGGLVGILQRTDLLVVVDEGSSPKAGRRRCAAMSS
jgi:hypothetical protein